MLVKDVIIVGQGDFEKRNKEIHICLFYQSFLT